MSNRIQTIVLLALSTLCAAATGYFFKPGQWYSELTLPSWNPPPQVFAIVWPILYLLVFIAVSVFCFRHYEKSQKIQKWYFIQILLNGLWTPLFFGAHFVVIACIELAVLNLVVWQLNREFKRQKSWWFLAIFPYQVWLLFALSLNFQIWRLNGS